MTVDMYDGKNDLKRQIADWKARAEAVEARLEAHMAYSCDLQRIIEDICHGREIRAPETSARFHYDMAVDYRTRLKSRRDP